MLFRSPPPQPQFSISSFLPKVTVSAPSPGSSNKATPSSTPVGKNVKGKAKVVEKGEAGSLATGERGTDELEAAAGAQEDQRLWVDRFGPLDRVSAELVEGGRTS